MKSLLAIAAVFLAPIPLACGGAATGETPRGVLLVSVDSLRADHVSCYGYRSGTRPDLDTTPILDRMVAARGARFTCAVSTTSWTLPSHMSMLTGLPNELHGVREIGFRLPRSKKLLAEVFQDAGWRTAGFWSGPNLDPWFGFGRGFERYVDCSTSRADDANGTFGAKDGMSKAKIQAMRDRLSVLHDGSHRGITGPQIVERFDEWFDELGDDDRFFAFVHMWDVHYDYTPPEEFDLFYPGYRGPENGIGVQDRSAQRDPPTADGLARILSLYDGEIRFTDHNLGLILGALEERGRLDDTLVVFTADHGEEFLEHMLFGHGDTLYEEAVRIPLLMRWPAGVPEQATIDVQVSLVDLAPTILDFCELPIPSGVWGTSLRGALAGEPGDLESRALPLERSYLQPGRKLRLDTIRGLHRGDHKILRRTDSDGGQMYFYDLSQDPREEDPILTGNLEKRDARVLAARELWGHLDLRAAKDVAFDEIPDELRDNLKDAGYLGDDPRD